MQGGGELGGIDKEHPPAPGLGSQLHCMHPDFKGAAMGSHGPPKCGVPTKMENQAAAHLPSAGTCPQALSQDLSEGAATGFAPTGLP